MAFSFGHRYLYKSGDLQTCFSVLKYGGLELLYVIIEEAKERSSLRPIFGLKPSRSHCILGMVRSLAIRSPKDKNMKACVPK